MTRKEYTAPAVVELGDASTRTLGALTGTIEPSAKRPV
jgi:hypothetical protein